MVGCNGLPEEWVEAFGYGQLVEAAGAADAVLQAARAEVDALEASYAEACRKLTRAGMASPSTAPETPVETGAAAVPTSWAGRLAAATSHAEAERVYDDTYPELMLNVDEAKAVVDAVRTRGAVVGVAGFVDGARARILELDSAWQLHLYALVGRLRSVTLIESRSLVSVVRFLPPSMLADAAGADSSAADDVADSGGGRRNSVSGMDASGTPCRLEFDDGSAWLLHVDLADYPLMEAVLEAQLRALRHAKSASARLFVNATADALEPFDPSHGMSVAHLAALDAAVCDAFALAYDAALGAAERDTEFLACPVPDDVLQAQDARVVTLFGLAHKSPALPAVRASRSRAAVTFAAPLPEPHLVQHSIRWKMLGMGSVNPVKWLELAGPSALVVLVELAKQFPAESVAVISGGRFPWACVALAFIRGLLVLASADPDVRLLSLAELGHAEPGSRFDDPARACAPQPVWSKLVSPEVEADLAAGEPHAPPPYTVVSYAAFARDGPPILAFTVGSLLTLFDALYKERAERATAKTMDILVERILCQFDDYLSSERPSTADEVAAWVAHQVGA
ncbi:uncharacterized protein AMSG_04470 [Thecamonas trahens ATCC 50062]|uniref:Uncharacterized protein n=1 Tax=Thecamonas trahens ATCC 50062 TaxID=461836 RepID=A0A0L0D7B0_THETB|nr:hypothetical protein AMSG_04470 [Thecamonas trahens ATCC 50062]KNC48239.1 hypothetical protein AMSG_04470 [Thecamonas trahens ATCC 50062]|eukprot:XP_013758808.1 hypothetical protein AMSG_04470 [Thecamonas trahens ATCC 50062]